MTKTIRHPYNAKEKNYKRKYVKIDIVINGIRCVYFELTVISLSSSLFCLSAIPSTNPHSLRSYIIGRNGRIAINSGYNECIGKITKIRLYQKLYYIELLLN